MNISRDDSKQFCKRSIVRLFIKILGVIAFCEAAAMVLLDMVALGGIWDIFLNPIVLAVMSTPLLYRFIIRPNQNAIKETEWAREQLKATNQLLQASLEQQATLMEEIESTNQELEDFAYIVSHDLKAPLRGIKTLAHWISTDHTDKLDDNGRKQIELLISRVNRMNNLIEGILQYSRIGRIKQEQVRVNLNELVGEVIATVAPPENIKVTIENELPEIECKRARITQIFENLLSNAVKHMDKTEGKIRIGCVEEEGFWKFSIADNGPGIEERNFEKIFKMFHTLRPRDEFESTGVGLTLTKKIVELYGGRIWVESKPSEGSTFFFTLSKEKIKAADDTQFQLDTAVPQPYPA